MNQTESEKYEYAPIYIDKKNLYLVKTSILYLTLNRLKNQNNLVETLNKF